MRVMVADLGSVISAEVRPPTNNRERVDDLFRLRQAFAGWELSTEEICDLVLKAVEELQIFYATQCAMQRREMRTYKSKWWLERAYLFLARQKPCVPVPAPIAQQFIQEFGEKFYLFQLWMMERNLHDDHRSGMLNAQIAQCGAVVVALRKASAAE